MGKFHPFQQAYRADPYPYLARLRETDPIHYSPDLQGYILTRYRDCAGVLRDDAHFSSDPGLESGGLGESVRRAGTFRWVSVFTSASGHRWRSWS